MGSTTKVRWVDDLNTTLWTTYINELTFSGRQYDGNGNVAEWWTPETVEKFEAEAQCYIKQYNAFCYDGIGECVSYCLASKVLKS